MKETKICFWNFKFILKMANIRPYYVCKSKMKKNHVLSTVVDTGPTLAIRRECLSTLGLRTASLSSPFVGLLHPHLQHHHPSHPPSSFQWAVTAAEQVFVNLLAMLSCS